MCFNGRNLEGCRTLGDFPNPLWEVTPEGGLSLTQEKESEPEKVF